MLNTLARIVHGLCPARNETAVGREVQGRVFLLILNWIGSSANARPVGKNHPLEKIRFEPFAGVSTVGVQWQGLGQGLPSWCSREFLWQVSMPVEDVRAALSNLQHCTNVTVNDCDDGETMNHSVSYDWCNDSLGIAIPVSETLRD